MWSKLRMTVLGQEEGRFMMEVTTAKQYMDLRFATEHVSSKHDRPFCYRCHARRD